jgi:hypothetical protein
MPNDLVHQNLLPAQSNQQPDPVTLASAATISPTTRFSFVTGTVQVANINPPTTGYCEVVLCFTDSSPGAFLTSGNVLTGYQPVQNRPVTLYYDRPTEKWYVGTVA